MKKNQMNTNMDLSNNNLDPSQVMPGQQPSGAMPSSKAATTVKAPPIPLTPLANAKPRPKKAIKSIAELKAIAAKMAPKKPSGGDYNG